MNAAGARVMYRAPAAFPHGCGEDYRERIAGTAWHPKARERRYRVQRTIIGVRVSVWYSYSRPFARTTRRYPGVMICA